MVFLQVASSTIERNIKALKVCTNNCVEEVESYVSVPFEEGQEEGLMLWQLFTK